MNVERAKRLGWIVDNLELQYSQINEIHDEECRVLSAVPEGDYLLFAFPLKLGGCDGAPVRAVLLSPG